MPFAKRLSPEKLMHAIRGQGLTFAEAAQRARRHLPDGSRLSHTSVWAYATGRATPKRLRYIEALEKAVGVEPHGLSDDRETGEAAFPDTADLLGASSSFTEGGVRLLISDTGRDKARVSMRLSLPWPIALKVLAALKAVEATDTQVDWR